MEEDVVELFFEVVGGGLVEAVAVFEEVEGLGAALGLPAVDLGEHVALVVDDAALPRRLRINIHNHPDKWDGMIYKEI